MTKRNILISTIAGTTAMTIFSYLVSRKKRRNFREPELLASMAEDLMSSKYHFLTRPIGWSGHYLAGCIIGTLHLHGMKKGGFELSGLNGLLAGSVYGTLAILVWKAHFSAHPNPPKINFIRFYGHLILAHIVFTVINNVAYSALNEHHLYHTLHESNPLTLSAPKNLSP